MNSWRGSLAKPDTLKSLLLPVRIWNWGRFVEVNDHIYIMKSKSVPFNPVNQKCHYTSSDKVNNKVLNLMHLISRTWPRTNFPSNFRLKSRNCSPLLTIISISGPKGTPWRPRRTRCSRWPWSDWILGREGQSRPSWNSRTGRPKGQIGMYFY